jgi:hypothetical protein
MTRIAVQAQYKVAFELNADMVHDLAIQTPKGHTPRSPEVFNPQCFG